MTKVKAAITVSLDGYITGPNDGPDKGLGEGGEALHTWVFGGPWTYESGPKGEATGVDKAYLDEGMRSQGAAIVGRNMYEAAGHWGDRNPWDVPTFVLTHRPEEQPDGDEFIFVGSLDEALSRAREAAGAKDVHLAGGADLIRQALAADAVDELSIIVAPLVLGGGKRLFDGFARRMELEQLGVRQSQFATFIDYRVKRA
jgi:dihydrofolate reductase